MLNTSCISKSKASLLLCCKHSLLVKRTGRSRCLVLCATESVWSVMCLLRACSWHPQSIGPPIHHKFPRFIHKFADEHLLYMHACLHAVCVARRKQAYTHMRGAFSHFNNMGILLVSILGLVSEFAPSVADGGCGPVVNGVPCIQIVFAIYFLTCLMTLAPHNLKLELHSVLNRS